MLHSCHQLLTGFLLATVSCLTAFTNYNSLVSLNEGKEEVVVVEPSKTPEVKEEKEEEPPVVEEVKKEEAPVQKEIEQKEMVKTDISEADIELIALVTMAEAEGESEEGKRLVIDTILNRVDSEHFPDTVRGVIYQKNQFSSVWGDRINRCYIRDDIVQLVREELVSRYNSDVIFFRTQRYSSYGVPMFKVGNHYFSSYN